MQALGYRVTYEPYSKISRIFRESLPKVDYRYKNLQVMKRSIIIFFMNFH